MLTVIPTSATQRSPTLKPLTSLPTVSATPTASWPGISYGSGDKVGVEDVEWHEVIWKLISEPTSEDIGSPYRELSHKFTLVNVSVSLLKGNEQSTVSPVSPFLNMEIKSWIQTPHMPQ
jgi:hypothetical protein